LTGSRIASDEVRRRFSAAMSDMYRREVPLYGSLLELVADVNRKAGGGLAPVDARRVGLERHGAIRLGTAEELGTMRRVLAVMGMWPVGYYDLSAAGVPVHSTAFRPIEAEALQASPFRLFTSLLRVELIEDQALRAHASAILARRRIFSARLLELTALHEERGGFTHAEADEFVAEALETFRWHHEAPVSASTYKALHDAHRLVADVVCFSGPHINHLTPRTLDIDAVHARMLVLGIPAKETIEGPPARKCPILLRQSSFKALEETIVFAAGGERAQGTHTARFGEIEQRGIALTRKGRALYDQLLAKVTAERTAGNDHGRRLAEAFAEFPDDLASLRRQGLAFFRYALSEAGRSHELGDDRADLEMLVERGLVRAEPILYEDFLPVSAAGIFQSNLGADSRRTFATGPARAAFEQALGCQVLDEITLYEQQQESIANVTSALRARAVA
jgi:uncharacterized glyoxalase superfamily metalloenzyme YdcJ